MSIFGKTAAMCLAFAAVMSVSATCFAGEWKDTAKGKTYITDSGESAKGFTEIDGKKYYFSKSGIMRTGWLETTAGNKYYCGSDGVLRTGWFKTASGKYYFGKNGIMYTGSKKIDGGYYLFGSDGVMLTGWQKADGGDYYYDTNGKRAVNRTIKIDGVPTKFDKNGKVITAKKSSSKSSKPAKEKEAIEPDSIWVTNDSFAMLNETSQALSYHFRPISTNQTEVTITSSNPSVVSVDEKREVINALKKGTATITIKSKSKPSVYLRIYITVE